MAKGKHLFPSRTQQLSPSAPRVLSWTRLGRVGRCRLPKKRDSESCLSFWLQKAASLPSRNTVRFCSALALRRGIHSRLGRQTANNGTSWRLICASRARSRTDVRLGRASRACSPPTCTILRRLIKLVCALLRFRERPRTIEVQRTTSSPQNHRKSLAQYCMVLLIQLFRNRLIIWIVFMIAILQRRKYAPFCAVFSGSQLPI